MSDNIYNDAIYLDQVPKNEWDRHIGNGYRSISYTVDAFKNGRIILFGYNTNNEPKTFICPWESYVKYNVMYETGELDVYDRHIATKYFRNKWERDKYVKAADGLHIVECLKPEVEFAHFMWDNVVLESNFNKHYVRIQSIDIETEISERFMPPSVAGNRINMITIFDNLTNKFYTWSLHHADIKFEHEPLNNYPRDMFVFWEFHDDEIAMLEHFISWIEDNYPDVSYGWNIRGYDWPYIVRRIEDVLGKNYAKRLSPVGKYFIKEVNHDNERADVSAEIEVTIDGLFIADGLILYRDKFGVAGQSLDGGYSLDNVGEHEGCGNKIKYNGTLKDLYLNDYQKFYEYNVRDVDLCKRIDDKCNMISLARQITSFGLVNHNAIYSSISYLIGSVMAFTKTEFDGKIFPSYLAERKKFDGFEGAFVFPAIPGVYRGGIVCIDFASLYPSNIRAINASPETYVGKILIYFKDALGNITCNAQDDARFNPFCDDDSEWEIDKNGNNVRSVINAGDPAIAKIELKYTNGKRKQLSINELKAIIEKRCIWTANNTLFLKHEVKQGVISKWCEVFYGLRKSTKKKELQCFYKLHDNDIKLSDDEIRQLETDEENYHTAQIGIKAMINSIYGLMGTPFSPIANPDMAQSVTRQGRFCNISTNKFIEEFFKRDYNASDDYVVASSGDTDSQFINIECVSKVIAERRGITPKVQYWPQDAKQELWDTINNFVNNEINAYVRKLVHDYCHTTQQDVLTYELEYMGDVQIMESMKHYAVHKIFEEGVIVDKTKYAGIELKKAQVPKEMKAYLAEIYAGVLNKEWSETDYRNYINELYEKFTKFTVDDISFWKGYNTERTAAGFLKMMKGTTGVAKSANYYNQLIQKHGLAKKYEEIRVGDKIRTLYIDENNQYGIDTLAYKPGQWPKEFDELFKPDYRVMFNKIILDPLKKFRIACKFKDVDPGNQMVEDIFQF